MLPRRIQIFKLLGSCELCAIFVLVMSFCPPETDALTRPIDRNARTLYYRNTPADARGHFNYEFQTTSGITIKAAGNENGHSGVVQYVSLEGLPITMTYVADANGYHPSGEHLPVAPAHVQKSLDYIRTHAAVDEKKSRRL